MIEVTNPDGSRAFWLWFKGSLTRLVEIENALQGWKDSYVLDKLAETIREAMDESDD